MNSKRKAELQRKLTLAPVPRPPVGLAERIKNDIPEYLRPDADRRRASRSLAFNLRIAASLLVVISSVFATLYLLEPEEQMKSITAVNRQGPTQVEAEMKAAAATDEVRVEITQEAAADTAATAATAAPAQPAALYVAPAEVAPAPQIASAETRRAKREEVESGVEYGVSGGVIGGVAGGVVGGTAGGRIGTVVAAAPPPPPSAAPQPVTAPEAITITAEAPIVEPQRAASNSLVREAWAADLDLRKRADHVFGISVDPSVFHAIKETLEKNQRPSANAVDLEAIVNYFAGVSPKPPRSGVRLEAEGSPSPVEGIGHRGFLRFSIDTASSTANLPIASNARLEIQFNDKIVEAAKPVGDSVLVAPESVLLDNVSVTGLYEVTLKTDRRSSERVATVRLSYDNVADGKRKTVERTVYARDFTKVWTRASRRHRLASLGAVWGQSLKVSVAPAPEVAKRAEELATQNPADARAQELATAAASSSKLGTSGF